MPRVLKLREFVKRMRELGVQVKKGKGSETKLFRPSHHLYTVKAHGDGEDVYPHVVSLSCRRLGISAEDFWKGL